MKGLASGFLKVSYQRVKLKEWLQFTNETVKIIRNYA